MSEELYHCYVDFWEEVQLRREPLTELGDEVVYVGTLPSDPTINLCLNHFTNAIAVDVERKEILPNTLTSFETQVERDNALLGASIIEGLTGDYILLLPVTFMEGEEVKDGDH